MVKYLVFCVFVAAGYIVYTNFPVNHGPGVTAKEEPNIKRLTWQEPFSFKGATMTPKNIIEAEVRIIKRKRYFFDRFSKYSPIDAIVGWNELSDERNLGYIYFTMDNRSFEIDMIKPPVKKEIVYKKTDLWHLIPSTAAIDEQLKKLRDGHIVKLEGLLVDISDDTNFDIATQNEIGYSQNSNGYIIWVENFNIR